jgi:beta-N-acetylhexosaminidase
MAAKTPHSRNSSWQLLENIPTGVRLSRRHLLLGLLVLAGCAPGSTTSASGSPSGPTSSTTLPTVTPAPNVAAEPTATTDTALDQRIDTFIATLSPAQMIGQTLLLAVYSSSDSDQLNQALAGYHPGGAVIFTNYNGGPLQPTTLGGLEQLVQGLKSHADVPLLLAADEEGGEVDRLAPYFGDTPSPQDLAASGDPQSVYAQAQTDASHMRAVGLNVNLAPLADVYQGGGIDQSRTFGTTPQAVITYAGAFLDGLQSSGIAGTLKHWPGLGAASGNPDFTLPTVSHSQDQLSTIDFAPFQSLLGHQPGMIMVTHVLVPAYDAQTPASLSPVLVDQVLRGQLGYQGVVISDAMDAQGLIDYMQSKGYVQAAQGIAEACVRAFLAGVDLIEAPIEQDRLAAVATAMTDAVNSGRISPQRLHQALHRIVALKVKLGLLTLS